MAYFKLFSKTIVFLIFCVLLQDNKPDSCSMEFINLHRDITCDCIAGTAFDNQSSFALKINKNKLRINDFLSKWEKNDRSEDCEIICLLKGKSLSQISDDNLDEIKEFYKTKFPLNAFAPSYKPIFAIVKFIGECGHVKKTPMALNPYHFTFYKCDTFSIDGVELVNSIELHNV